MPDELPPMKADYVGPCTIDCHQKCDVPAGAALAMVPRPRHNWPGMAHCPNCYRSFMILAKPGDSLTTQPT